MQALRLLPPKLSRGYFEFRRGVQLCFALSDSKTDAHYLAIRTVFMNPKQGAPCLELAWISALIDYG